MASVEKTVLIEHSAARMFELVDRCEDYPAFLPWCSRGELKQRDAQKTVRGTKLMEISARPPLPDSSRQVKLSQSTSTAPW